MKQRTAWNKGKKCPQLAGSNNGMYKKKRPELSIRNKTLTQRIAVIKFNQQRKHSTETKKKIGLKSKQSNLKLNWWKKESNPSWKGGISTVRKGLASYTEYQDWRKKILERDNNQCLMCLYKHNLQVHHITPVYEDSTKIIDVDNGITLCKQCHIMTHHPSTRPEGWSVA